MDLVQTIRGRARFIEYMPASFILTANYNSMVREILEAPTGLDATQIDREKFV